MNPSPLVVGTIHSPGALRCALKLRVGQLDLLELRVDAFADAPEKLHAAASGLKLPLLVTVRHPREGGVAKWTLADRRRLYRQFLPIARWMDVEVRSLTGLREEIAFASEAGVRVIISDHHFKRTPPLETLKQRFNMALQCRPTGPELPVVKVAASANSLRELETLVSFFQWAQKRAPGRVALMGMGRFGQVSRLLFGGCGSVLNYGYLDKPQVPGQWPALLLKERLAELAV
jgi:3-dehydroquinate dehydratase-1